MVGSSISLPCVAFCNLAKSTEPVSLTYETEVGLMSSDQETGPVSYKKRRLVYGQNITIVGGTDYRPG
jgi:hypothetical protein